MGWTSFGNLGMPSPATGELKTDKGIKVRLTTYHRNEDYWTRRLRSSSGYTLKEGISVACDPKIFDYGTKIMIQGVGIRQVHDTGTAVVAKKASNGKLPVVDIFFLKESSAEKFANSHKYAQVWVVK
jgi:3D (Asp-Asp-Asp) domain-containing protein